MKEDDLTADLFRTGFEGDIETWERSSDVRAEEGQRMIV